MADARERLKQLAKNPPKGVEVKVPPPRKTPPMPKKVPRARVERAYMSKDDSAIEVRAGATTADGLLKDQRIENSTFKNSPNEHSGDEKAIPSPDLVMDKLDENPEDFESKFKRDEHSTFENSGFEPSADDVASVNPSAISSVEQNSIFEKSALLAHDEELEPNTAGENSTFETSSSQNSESVEKANLSVEPATAHTKQNSTFENSRSAYQVVDFTKDISYVRSLIRKLEANRHVRDLYEDLYLETQRTGLSAYIFTTEQLMERCGVARATVQRMRDRAKESPLFECNVSHNKSSSVGRQGTHFQLKAPW